MERIQQPDKPLRAGVVRLVPPVQGWMSFTY